MARNFLDEEKEKEEKDIYNPYNLFLILILLILSKDVLQMLQLLSERQQGFKRKSRRRARNLPVSEIKKKRINRELKEEKKE